MLGDLFEDSLLLVRVFSLMPVKIHANRSDSVNNSHERHACCNTNCEYFAGLNALLDIPSGTSVNTLVSGPVISRVVTPVRILVSIIKNTFVNIVVDTVAVYIICEYSNEYSGEYYGEYSCVNTLVSGSVIVYIHIPSSAGALGWALKFSASKYQHPEAQATWSSAQQPLGPGRRNGRTRT